MVHLSTQFAMYITDIKVNDGLKWAIFELDKFFQSISLPETTHLILSSL